MPPFPGEFNIQTEKVPAVIYFQKPKNILIIKNMQRGRREGLHIHVLLFLVIYEDKMDFHLFIIQRTNLALLAFAMHLSVLDI